MQAHAVDTEWVHFYGRLEIFSCFSRFMLSIVLMLCSQGQQVLSNTLVKYGVGNIFFKVLYC
jgi:hypothetical protein